MTKKLDLDQSVQIVLDAIGEISANEYGDLSDALILGEILVTVEQRDLFRTKVHTRVKSVGFAIDRNKIPNKSDVTIGHVANELTISALPGDTTADDPA